MGSPQNGVVERKTDLLGEVRLIGFFYLCDVIRDKEQLLCGCCTLGAGVRRCLAVWRDRWRVH